MTAAVLAMRSRLYYSLTESQDGKSQLEYTLGEATNRVTAISLKNATLNRMAPKPAFTIWCNYQFTPEAVGILRAGLGQHQLVFASRQTRFGPVTDDTDELLARTDIALGQPDPDLAMQQGRLQWIHICSAGYTSYDRDDFRAAMVERGVSVTNSSTVYSHPCALHVLAMMTSLARQLPASLTSQSTGRLWPSDQIRASSRLLTGETVLILGFGAIGRRLVELISPLGMKVLAVRRRIRGDEAIPIITEQELDRHLSIADHLIDILPANSSTKNFLNAQRLRALKPGAIVYNIGRGTTMDHEALRSLLQSGHLAAAYLDVTDPEPLPGHHPLWTTRNCYITPHTAGGSSAEMEQLVRHFLNNLNRFVAGDPLLDRII